MKKLPIILLATLLTLIPFSSALGSSIGIGVGPVVGFELDKPIQPSTDLFELIGFWGLNDHLMLMSSYLNTDPNSTCSLGFRYAFNPNLAVAFNYYTTTHDDTIITGLRGKTDLTDKLDLAGRLDYKSNTDSSATQKVTTTTIQFLGQAEYKLSESFATNLGISSVSTNDSGTTISYLIGGEFYPNNHWYFGFDYEIPTNNRDSDSLTTVISYVF